MKKDSFWRRVGDVLMGKGFYMVLLLCVTAIGASGYYLYDLANTELEEHDDAAVSAPAEVELEVDEQAEAEAAVSDEEMTDEELQQELADVLAQAEAEAERNEDAEETVILPEPEPVEEPAEEAAETSAEVSGEETPAQPEETAAEPAEETGGFVLPVEGEAVAVFSNQELTYNAAMGDWRTHNGVDLAAELGDPVLAAMDGEVLEVREDLLLGTTVTINHGDGLMTVYGNLSHDVAVAQGDAIKAGDTIGTVGATAVGEWNEGNWIHFAVKQDGEPVDPSDYLAKSEAP